MPVEDFVKVCKNDKLNLEHEYQLVLLINKYLKLRAKPEYKPKVKGPVRFQDTEDGAKLWPLLTIEEQRARDEIFDKEN